MEDGHQSASMNQYNDSDYSDDSWDSSWSSVESSHHAFHTPSPASVAPLVAGSGFAGALLGGHLQSIPNGLPNFSDLMNGVHESVYNNGSGLVVPCAPLAERQIQTMSFSEWTPGYTFPSDLIAPQYYPHLPEIATSTHATVAAPSHQPPVLMGLASPMSGTVSSSELSYVDSTGSGSIYNTDMANEQPQSEGVRAGNADSEHLGRLPHGFCPFSSTTLLYPMWDKNGLEVTGELHAEFDKKFLKDHTSEQLHYTAYRRNYFGVLVNYQLISPNTSKKGPLYIHDGDLRYFVKRLAVRIKAVKDDGETEIEIVSHNAQRKPLDPKDAPLEQSMQPNMPGSAHVYDDSTGFKYPKYHLPSHHTFKRLQFRKATENNGHRRKDQRYHRIVIELCAAIDQYGQEKFLTIATTVSGLIVVYGRGPSSHEQPDPNNRRRQPRKHRGAHGSIKGSKPTGITKKSGPPKAKGRIVKAEKSEWGHRARNDSSSTGSFHTAMATLDPSSTKAPTTPEDISPLMVPTHEMPQNRLLPFPKGKREELSAPNT